MKRIPSHVTRIWETDIALTALLIFLLIYIFFLFPMAHIDSVRFLTGLFFYLILITGTIAATKNRILRTLVVSWAL